MFDLLPIGTIICEPEMLYLLVFRFVLNLVAIGILIRFIYYPIKKNREYLFVFFIFNILIFFVASLLSTAGLETGFAFGLFAIFSILRYRTRTIPIREMTFLFISIIMATINSTVTQNVGLSSIFFANVIILIVSFLMERAREKIKHKTKMVYYDRMDLIRPETREAMLADLKMRTGLVVSDFEIVRTDFHLGLAHVRITYTE